MFEPLRDALRGLSTRLDPDERRTMTQAMRDALVHAKLGLNDLRALLATTNTRLAAERAELETVRRRQGLAAQINDEETVAIAERFASQHQERVLMLETKQMVQQQELSLAERDYEEMSVELRLIKSGVAPGVRSKKPGAKGAPANEPGTAFGAAAAAESVRSDGLPADLDLEEKTAAGVDGVMDDPLADPLVYPRRRTRAERDAEAEQRLAALKRRMGK